MEQKKYRLADLFDSFWDAYKAKPKHYITSEQYKAVSAIRNCRTEALGVDHYVCSSCGDISHVYHSCKNRFCPTCSWKDTLDWARKLESEMLGVSHRHVVFTLPHSLNGLVNSNKRKLLGVLFQSAAASLKDWMYHKYQLVPGIISVLHTYGEKKNLHPHIHMIVSWGGLTSTDKIVEIEKDYINYTFLQTKFRCKFEDDLMSLYRKGHLVHDFGTRIDFLRFIKRINKNQWRIHMEPSMTMPSQVIRYIGRYSKRACISEYKISDVSGEYITFKYKDYKHINAQGRPMEKELQLHYSDFIPRLLQHVPLPYFRLVRYYGVYSARGRSKLKSEGLISAQGELLPEEGSTEEQENPKCCKYCNQPKQYLYSTFLNAKGARMYMSRFNRKRENDKPNQQVA